MKIISCTGFGIREPDNWGSGKFGAPRGNKLHKGADFNLCEPGEKMEVGRFVVSPCDGKVVRKVWVYKGEHYTGILIANKFGLFKLFYFVPFKLLKFGISVKMGQEIGSAQDISKRALPNKYPGMTPHIHLQIQIHPDNLFTGEAKEYINPEVLM